MVAGTLFSGPFRSSYPHRVLPGASRHDDLSAVSTARRSLILDFLPSRIIQYTNVSIAVNPSRNMSRATTRSPSCRQLLSTLSSTRPSRLVLRRESSANPRVSHVACDVLSTLLSPHLAIIVIITNISQDPLAP